MHPGASYVGDDLRASAGAPPIMLHVDPQNVVVLEPRPPRGSTNLALTLLALLALLLLLGGAALVGARWGQSQASERHATATTSGAGSATTQPATAPPSTSPTSGAGTAVAAPATPGATQTRPSDSHPALTVAPTQIALSPCIAASAQFQVRNDGGGALTWTANASNSLYTIDPPSGSLGYGDAQPVMVTNITLGGQITITAPGAANAPQTVTITCK
jgi:hypothetical protein